MEDEDGWGRLTVAAITVMLSSALVSADFVLIRQITFDVVRVFRASNIWSLIVL